MEPTIDIEGLFVSTNEFKKIIAKTNEFFKLPNESHFLQINIKNTKFEELDIALIGYLGLCKSKLPDLTITIKLPYNSNTSGKESFFNRLASYNLYSNILYGKPILSIKYTGDSQRQSTYAMKLHRTFSPILAVGEFRDINCYNFLFNEPLLPEKLLEQTHNQIKKNYSTLARKALQRCKAAIYYDKYEDKKSLNDVHKLQYLDKQQSKKYFEVVSPIIKELNTKPPAFHFLFSLLLQNTKPPQYPTKQSKEERQEDRLRDLINRVHDLWLFTKELFHGINELAKNISEHATTKQGIITLRAYGEHYFGDRDNSPFKPINFSQSLGQNRELIKCLVDVNVFDLGDKGVMPTLIEMTKSALDSLPEKSAIYEYLVDDLRHLNSPGSGINNMLSIDNKVIKHQQKRSVAHLGLLSLAALVRKNKGAIFASSIKDKKGKSTRDIYISEESLKGVLDMMPTTGTAFNILVPVIEGDHPRPIFSKMKENRKLKLEDIQAFNELIRFGDISSNLEKNKQEQFSIIKATKPNRSGRDAEKQILDKICFEVECRKIDDNKNAVCLDFEALTETAFNASQLFRIIATLEIDYPTINFVLFNLKNEWINELLLLNDFYINQDDHIDYWNRNKATLIINFIEGNERRFYFTDVLWGATRDDFLALNKIVDNTHFNSICLESHAEENNIDFLSVNLPNFENHSAFINQHVMLPIDLLLKSGTHTLFEYNASFLLQNELLPNFNDVQFSLLQNILNRPGFKISGTHFKIGSKIHATDFYYAKRFFQSSFYASRFALLLAQKISKLITENQCANDNLTLIGYGLYSELLISLTKNFLKRILKISGRSGLAENISDNIIEDDKNLKLIKSNKIHHENLVIIVPIASTFSTGFKIDQSVRKTDGGSRVYLNVLVAYDHENETLCKTFGWEDIDEENRIIKVQHSNEDILSDQHFFLSVPTKWYSPISDPKCELCYPNKPSKGKALFTTDKTSVTPALIFDLPKARAIPDDVSYVNLKEEHIQYGHHIRNDKHFLLSINTDIFLNDHREAIKKWLRILYKKENLANPTDKVLLIADCHHTNIEFINLVNEIVFLSSATIVHFDSKIDYVDNFKLIYKQELDGADKIYFVDDSLKSGSTFNRIHFLVFNASTKRINGCITLLNKMQPKDEDWIKSKLQNGRDGNTLILSYTHYHLFSSVDYSHSSSLEYEEQRYTDLSNNAVLDRLINHFDLQRKKVSCDQPESNGQHERLPNSEELELISPSKPHTPRKEIVCATHMIYELFAKIGDNINEFKYIFEKWERFVENLNISINKPTSKDALLKVLTQYPLTQYKLVREKVFSWVSEEFSQNLEKLSSYISRNKSVPNEDIIVLKYYIRRVCKLDSSQLLRESTIDRILIIADHFKNRSIPPDPTEPSKPTQIEIPDDREMKDKLKDLSHTERFKETPEEFCYFFASQIMELIHEDATRCINLEVYLREKLKKYNELGQYGQKILRILFFENINVIKSSWRLINTHTVFSKLYKKEIEEGFINPNAQKLIDGIKNNIKIVKNPRYKYLTSFLNCNPIENSRYISYLWVETLLHNDEIDQSRLNSKTNEIMKKLVSLFCDDDNIKMGAFWGVHSVYKPNERGGDQNDNAFGAFPIYDQNSNSGSILQNYYWNTNELEILDKLTGINNELSNKTVFVYKRLKNRSSWGSWENVIEAGSEIPDQATFSFLPPESDLLVLAYTRSKKTNKPQSILGFYSDPKTDAERPTSSPVIQVDEWLTAIRYILHLRRSLRRFITRHHENYEFFKMKEAQEKQFTVTLMGHGRDTIPRFAQHANLPLVKPLPAIINNLIMIAASASNDVEIKQFLKDRFCNPERKTLEEIKSRYENLAKFILESKYIELKLDMGTDIDFNIVLSDDRKEDFYFEFTILDLFMLELIINAKKNRWLYLKECEDELKNYIKIKISVTKEVEKKKIIIKVSNSGPGFAAGVEDRLNYGKPIKKAYEISGIGLIHYFMDKFFAAEKGCSINFCEEPDGRSGSKMKIAIATLTLGEWE